MKILLLHNRYQIAGGEDTVVAAETTLLRERGHEVALLEVANAEIQGAWAKVRTALGTVYSPTSRRLVAEAIARERPDIVHVHNFFPLLSPSVYYAARAAGVPVVQTLHNYRLICPNALLFRDGHICEDCVGRIVPWPGIWHACYRGSRAGSAAVAAMISWHRLSATWQSHVDQFIALTDFARSKLIAGGLPADKIVVKPNFVHPAPLAGDGHGRYALYVGRLSPEKGVRTLLEAWSRLPAETRLTIIGDGPLAGEVRAAVRAQSNILWRGGCTHDTVLQAMRAAAVLIVPSEWYEGFPMVVVEAFAAALPIIASNCGSLSTLIEHGRTGRHFPVGDAAALAAEANWVFSHPNELAQMRRAARAEFEAKYTAQRNYEMLMAIYQKALAGKSC